MSCDAATVVCTLMSFGTTSGGLPCTIISLDPRALKLASKSVRLSSKKLNLFVPTLHIHRLMKKRV